MTATNDTERKNTPETERYSDGMLPECLQPKHISEQQRAALSDVLEGWYDHARKLETQRDSLLAALEASLEAHRLRCAGHIHPSDHEQYERIAQQARAALASVKGAT